MNRAALETAAKVFATCRDYVCAQGEGGAVLGAALRYVCLRLAFVASHINLRPDYVLVLVHAG